MVVEQGMTLGEVRIRVSRRDWMPVLLLAGSALLFGASNLLTEPPGFGSGHAWSFLILGALVVAEALWLRSFGIGLTPQLARVRGIIRRDIPWQQVQAVTQFIRLGARGVRLLLDRGESVTLRAPTTLFGLGTAAYERDFHRIGQWWLARRGPDWRPVIPEAPRDCP